MQKAKIKMQNDKEKLKGQSGKPFCTLHCNFDFFSLIFDVRVLLRR
jgi:hypothetical protein